MTASIPPEYLPIKTLQDVVCPHCGIGHRDYVKVLKAEREYAAWLGNLDELRLDISSWTICDACQNEFAIKVESLIKDRHDRRS